MPGVPLLRAGAAFGAAAYHRPLTLGPGKTGVAVRDEEELLVNRLLAVPILVVAYRRGLW